MRSEDIKKLAALILKHLRESGTATFRVPENQVEEKIGQIVFNNLDEEAKIEETAKKLMEQHRAQMTSGAIDPQKAYMMIKKQVAKERKFVL